MRTTVMFMSTIMSAIIVLGGLGLTFYHLAKGFSDNDSDSKSKALRYFFMTIAIVFAWQVVIFLIALAL